MDFSLRYQFVLFFLGLCFLYGNAQKEITMTQVLLGAKEVQQVKFDAVQLEFLKEYNHKLPLVSNVALRTETKDLMLRRQEYAIRITPNSLRGVLAKKKVYQSKINEVELQGRIQVNEELEDRYYVLVDYICNEKLIAAYEVRKMQLEDKITILKQTIYTEKFEVNDLLDTEEVLFNTQIDLQNLREVQAYHHAVLQLMIGERKNTITLKSNDLLTPAQILATTFVVQEPRDNLEVQLQQLQLETIEDEMKLDIAKSKKIIDFVQVKYGGKENELFDEKFGIGVGVNLPFFGNARAERGDYYFKKLRAESEMLALQNAQEQEINTAEENFRRVAAKYQVYKDQMERSSVSSLLNTYKKMEGVSPLILLKLKMSEHNKNIETIKIEHELYEKYITMLASTGVLFQTPFVNFLTSNVKTQY